MRFWVVAASVVFNTDQSGLTFQLVHAGCNALIRNDYCLTVSFRWNFATRKLYVEMAIASCGVSHSVRAPTPSNNAGTPSVRTIFTNASTPPCSKAKLHVKQPKSYRNTPCNQTSADYFSELAISSSRGPLVMSTQKRQHRQ
jgi:hypothetical protein